MRKVGVKLFFFNCISCITHAHTTFIFFSVSVATSCEELHCNYAQKYTFTVIIHVVIRKLKYALHVWILITLPLMVEILTCREIAIIH